ncbi:nuclear fragile X mental retardation-interacting protein 1 [Caerostris extrusa]|uniref:Nuclear fragile X mental retardation-interacting protein 1 n=1 Tax=Caerostris extrusa TaxID=172846 RepID=A0AAV4PN59_CAEEX|nr:nuclear fragile X mental retardation-interacting protein 1 [Caerostris extrusa]
MSCFQYNPNQHPPNTNVIQPPNFNTNFGFPPVQKNEPPSFYPQSAPSSSPHVFQPARNAVMTPVWNLQNSPIQLGPVSNAPFPINYGNNINNSGSQNFVQQNQTVPSSITSNGIGMNSAFNPQLQPWIPFGSNQVGVNIPNNQPPVQFYNNNDNNIGLQNSLQQAQGNSNFVSNNGIGMHSSPGANMLSGLQNSLQHAQGNSNNGIGMHPAPFVNPGNFSNGNQFGNGIIRPPSFNMTDSNFKAVCQTPPAQNCYNSPGNTVQNSLNFGAPAAANNWTTGSMNSSSNNEISEGNYFKSNYRKSQQIPSSNHHRASHSYSNNFRKSHDHAQNSFRRNNLVQNGSNSNNAVFSAKKENNWFSRKDNNQQKFSKNFDNGNYGRYNKHQPKEFKDRNGYQPFACDTCDRSFCTTDQLNLHLSEHIKCDKPNCQFTAHPKVVAIHQKLQHDTGYAEIINKLNDDEDAIKWREERKRRFPTAENIRKRKAEQAELEARGEIHENQDKSEDMEKSKKLKLDGNKRNPNKSLKRNRHSKPRHRSLPYMKVSPEVLVDSGSDDEPIIKLKKFRGMSMLSEKKSPDDSNLISSPENPNGKVHDALDESQPSQSDQKQQEEKVSDEEPKKEETPNSVELVEDKAVDLDETSENVNKPGNRFSKFKHNKLTGESSSNRHDRFSRKYTDTLPSLTERVFESDIKHTDDVIMQCISYIAKKDFFGKDILYPLHLQGSCLHCEILGTNVELYVC